METIEEREDVEDVKDAEEARQEPGERVDAEEQVDEREPGKCEAELILPGQDSGEQVAFQCETIGPHTVHMTRGVDEYYDKEREAHWKLVWDVQG